MLVGSTARMKKTVPKIVKGGFYHAGQVCVSVQRVFALGLAARDLAEQIGELAQELVVGNAINEGTECGPLIRHREVDRVESWVNEAISSGGTLISGGNRLSLSTFSPTVILDPDPNCQISTKEIFGPVVCVFSCNSLDEVITRANNLPFAFQASVFSNDFEEIMTACNELDASAVMVNEHTAFRVDWMPFSGRRQSGYGTGGIRYTMEDMSNDKMRVLSYS